ncbi:MAG: hypothetical protein ACLR0U_32145 [Enterocloster clostridioformis]
MLRPSYITKDGRLHPHYTAGGRIELASLATTKTWTQKTWKNWADTDHCRLGVDSRNGKLGKDNNADVQMLCSITETQVKYALYHYTKQTLLMNDTANNGYGKAEPILLSRAHPAISQPSTPT